MKTDLQKILSISGESGLFLFLSQTKGGIIAESLVTKKRSSFGINAKITALSDISIYTINEEVPLKSLLEKMNETLSGEIAPDPKSKPEVLADFFQKVLPDYDKDRFYHSHMKKVVGWYNILREFSSLDFVEEEKPENE